MFMFYVVGAFFFAMAKDIHADKPRLIVAEIDGKPKVVRVRRYHPIRPMSIHSTNDIGEGFYYDVWGDIGVRRKE